MRSRIGALMIAFSLWQAGAAGLAQTAAQTQTPAQSLAQAPAQTASQSAPAKASQEPAADEPAKPPVSPTSLAGEADTLYELAAELKVQVDRTNKNILSMTVVRKAQAIEQLAHQMKLQAKK